MYKTRVCTKCKVRKKMDKFGIKNERHICKDGTISVYTRPQAACKKCHCDYAASRRVPHPKIDKIIRDGKKKCSVCKVFKPFSSFGWQENGPLQLKCRCKKCNSKIVTAKEKISRDSLSDNYVKARLYQIAPIGYANIPPVLIEIKRLQLKLKRKSSEERKRAS